MVSEMSFIGNLQDFHQFIFNLSHFCGNCFRWTIIYYAQGSSIMAQKKQN